jgi:hypothetical protein
VRSARYVIFGADLDDIQMAVGRLEHHQPVLTAEQARKAVGLDD